MLIDGVISFESILASTKSTHKHLDKINGIERNQIWFSFIFICFHILYMFLCVYISGQRCDFCVGVK